MKVSELLKIARTGNKAKLYKYLTKGEFSKRDKVMAIKQNETDNESSNTEKDNYQYLKFSSDYVKGFLGELATTIKLYQPTTNEVLIIENSLALRKMFIDTLNFKLLAAAVDYNKKIVVGNMNSMGGYVEYTLIEFIKQMHGESSEEEIQNGTYSITKEEFYNTNII